MRRHWPAGRGDPGAVGVHDPGLCDNRGERRVFAITVASGAAVVFWDEGGWAGLPIALALLALAAGLYIGRDYGQQVDGWRSDVIKRLLVFAACMLPATIAFPVTVHWLAGRHLEAGGYTPCGRSFWIAPDRMPDRQAALARCEEWRRG